MLGNEEACRLIKGSLVKHVSRGPGIITEILDRKTSTKVKVRFFGSKTQIMDVQRVLTWGYLGLVNFGEDLHECLEKEKKRK